VEILDGRWVMWHEVGVGETVQCTSTEISSTMNLLGRGIELL
jgi:hypothetical protein